MDGHEGIYRAGYVTGGCRQEFHRTATVLEALSKKSWIEYDGNIAVWLDSDENPEQITGGVGSLPLIALNFPVFSDGRSYTSARELRQKHAFKGEVRAIGDVLRDQLYYMAQCGFDTFEIRHDQEPELCLDAFKDFETGYQSTITQPTPLFRRR